MNLTTANNFSNSSSWEGRRVATTSQTASSSRYTWQQQIILATAAARKVVGLQQHFRQLLPADIPDNGINNVSNTTRLS
jgi:hypothetical protein